jgi:hypothetical protein
MFDFKGRAKWDVRVACPLPPSLPAVLLAGGAACPPRARASRPPFAAFLYSSRRAATAAGAQRRPPRARPLPRSHTKTPALLSPSLLSRTVCPRAPPSTRRRGRRRRGPRRRPRWPRTLLWWPCVSARSRALNAALPTISRPARLPRACASPFRPLRATPPPPYVADPFVSVREINLFSFSVPGGSRDMICSATHPRRACSVHAVSESAAAHGAQGAEVAGPLGGPVPPPAAAYGAGGGRRRSTAVSFMILILVSSCFSPAFSSPAMSQAASALTNDPECVCTPRGAAA